MLFQALGAAALWGGTDVLAGVSARRSSPLLAATWLHIASLVVLCPLLFLPRTWHALSFHDCAFGALAGVAAAIGDVFFGKALSKGAMTVGIPLANVIAASLPAVLAIFQSEHVTAYAALAIIGALLSTGLASAPTKRGGGVVGVADAVTAGILFGIMYALLSQCAATDALIVILAMRIAGMLALTPSLITARRAKAVRIGSGVFPGIASGLASVGANALFVFALSNGNHALLSVLAVASAAPAALIITLGALRERLTGTQIWSAVIACSSITIAALSTTAR